MKLAKTLLLLAAVGLGLSACAVPAEPGYVSAYPYGVYDTGAYDYPYYDYGPAYLGVWGGWHQGWDRHGYRGGWHPQNASHVSRGASAVSHAWHGGSDHRRG
jgi:hypothetical protein